MTDVKFNSQHAHSLGHGGLFVTLKVKAYAVFFSFQNNPKNLDPSYKMDLDFWDCLGRVKLE